MWYSCQASNTNLLIHAKKQKNTPIIRRKDNQYKKIQKWQIKELAHKDIKTILYIFSICS